MKKLGEIQRLRGIAVLMVIWAHANYIRNILPESLYRTWTGVDIFFVISGYVVGRSLLKNFSGPESELKATHYVQVHMPHVWSFYSRRLFRIVPLALTWLLIPLLLSVVFNASGSFGQPKELMREIASVISLHYNYLLPVQAKGQFDYYWSLMVEEHFYILLPLLLLFVRRNESRLLSCLGLAAIIGFIVRPLAPIPFPMGSWSFHTASRVYSHLRLDSPAIGVALALLQVMGLYPLGHAQPSRLRVMWFNSVTLVLLGIIALSPGIFPFKVMYSVGLTSVAALSCLIVWWASLDKGYVLEIPGLRRILEYVGERSFGIYLCHRPVMELIEEVAYRVPHFWPPGSPVLIALIHFIAVLAGTVACAEFTYRTIERPFILMGNTTTR
jgi:peptidoglycan/LPS O-acetylase OafA/YrhL